MKRNAATRLAFTLIELLIVISIMALLAALIFPVTAAINKNKLRSKARAELAQVEMAIAAYKAKLGHYPPDNPGNPRTNQLYFELMGTALDKVQNVYQTLDGGARIKDDPATFLAVFGSAQIGGFVNCSKGGGGDEAQTATSFLRNIKPGQVGDITNIAPDVKILVCSIPWPQGSPYVFGVSGLNPICYNSSNPTNNPDGYDLWIDVVIGGKTNRISNWSREPLIVGAP